MTQRTLMRWSFPAALATLFSGVASAAGFQLLEQNASGIGNAYAGSAAVAENASTIYFNPAGMTMLQAREFSAGLSLIKPSAKFTNNGSVVLPAATGSNGGDAGDWGFVPNGYLSWALSKDLYAGVGVSAPFGLKTQYDEDWVGRFQSIMFEIKTYNINPSIAYRVNDKFSIGAGVNWQRLEATYERQAAVLNALTQATRVKLDVADDSWGWNAGVLFNPSPSTRIGLSYRSTIEHNLTGNLTSSNQLVSPNVGAGATIKLPDTAILSIVQKLDDRWEMLGDLSWTGWSSIKQVPILRSNGSIAQTLEPQFRDTTRIALGGNYKYSDEMKFKFGVAWDQTPVRSPERRLVALPDEDRIWLSVGTQWKPSPASTLDFGLSYLFVSNPQINNNQTLQGRGLVKGEYKNNIAILGAQYSMRF